MAGNLTFIHGSFLAISNAVFCTYYSDCHSFYVDVLVASEGLMFYIILTSTVLYFPQSK
ncbi:hypothetical protein F4604DRAFT_1750574 [Suillus subluteus]|nr:hypothetical protein F4604DRAFT_1750574 [Suillus subluteus]